MCQSATDFEADTLEADAVCHSASEMETDTDTRAIAEDSDMGEAVYMRSAEMHDTDSMGEPVYMKSADMHDSDMDDPIYVRSGEMQYENEPKDNMLGVPIPKRTLAMNDDVLGQPPIKPEEVKVSNANVMRAFAGNGILKGSSHKDRLSVDSESKSNSIRRKDTDPEKGTVFLRLKMLATFEAKIAKICNFWTF